MVSKTDPAGESWLAAYLVSLSHASPGALHLRRQLFKELSAYMVPVYFEYLDRFPLTANGKIDRSALPYPNWEGDRSAVTLHQPTSDLEGSLQEIWSQALNTVNIGVGENFFETGGIR